MSHSSAQAAGGEVDEFGILTGAVDDAATAHGWDLDKAEGQIAVYREASINADRDDPASAMIAFVQPETGRHDHAAALIFVLTADQPAAAVAGLPCGQFLA